MASTTQTERHPLNTLERVHALERARQGDRKAFSRLMEPYRRELIGYCYRLTGGLAEAEDLVQEAFVRAFRGLDGFEGRASLRAWLYRIAHNLCLNHVQRQRPAWESLDEVPAERLEAPGGEGQGREDVRLGFVALVQSLPPRQRAALVLRDVLGWSAEEAARILEMTIPAVKNALARARQTLARHPHGSDPADVQDWAATDPAARAMVAEWVDAFEKGNSARMVALLTGADTSRLRAAEGGPLNAAPRGDSPQSGYNQTGRADTYDGKKAPHRGQRYRRQEPSEQREERTDA